MYSKVLVPLDGSGTAEKVLPLARCLARGLQIPIELLAVVDIAEMARHISADQASSVRSLVDDTARAADHYLQRVAKNFPTGNLECKVRSGNAPEVIIESARAEKDGLIAMATHGRSGLDRWLLGSVAEKVLRAASNPTLVVRTKEENNPAWEMGTLKRIIVPLDGSELSERILPHVEALAKQLDLEVLLLSVYGGPFTAKGSGDGFFRPSQVEAIVAELRSEVVGYLAIKTEDLKWKGLEKASFAARQGLAADEIIAAARETEGALIAMCTHGRSGVKRWMLGSVTETVVRHSGAPVLVVRAS